MFNRTITVRMEKKDKKDKTPMETSGDENFDKKADAVLYRLEELGAKMFLGVCAYILLDTYRQVKVAQAIYQPTE